MAPATATPPTKTSVGYVTQIIGPVVDAEFPPGELPNIYDALTINDKSEAGDDIVLTLETQQLLGDNKVRAVAMDSTDGMKRGMKITNTGAPISVPVGQPVLGRILNVLGQPVDRQGWAFPSRMTGFQPSRVLMFVNPK